MSQTDFPLPSETSTTPPDEAFRLQSLLFPEAGISTEREIYMRLTGTAGYSDSRRVIEMHPGSRASFDTAFNLFNLGKWQANCGLTDLQLILQGSGRFELSVFQALEGHSWERVITEVVSLIPGVPLETDLSDRLSNDGASVLFFQLLCLESGKLEDAIWQTRQPPRQLPKIALSITTFRREEAVRASVRRFEDFISQSPLASSLHLIVVDNGNSADIAPSAHVTPIPNENYGGSGGFARGLIEAERIGMTHCLFMDDDASIHMQVLDRVWAFLAYAQNPETAVAGGLAMANHRWSIWENGAVFDMHCHPQYIGTDMRDFAQILSMEFGTSRPHPPNYYGGWWFFAFPVAFAKHRPFPFFVRGDDISFSIANDFRIVTLPGVICFQDADFSDKESLQTLYLDLRSHVIHHLALPAMDTARIRILSIPVRFFMRSFLQLHYETLEALNISFEDVMRGPGFFADNADMARRRADLGKIRIDEAWKPLKGPAPVERIRLCPEKSWVRWLMKLTLNGHLLPFFSHWGNRRVLEAGQRGRIRETWAAAEITYLDGQGNYFTVRHSKGKALRQGLRMLRNLLRFNRNIPGLKTQWRDGYNTLATNDFWQQKLKCSDSDSGSDPAR